MIHARAFDSAAFADRLQAALAAREISLREAARRAGVSPATLSRACNGWPDLSHENYLRLTAWLDAPQGEQERNAA